MMGAVVVPKDGVPWTPDDAAWWNAAEWRALVVGVRRRALDGKVILTIEGASREGTMSVTTEEVEVLQA